MTKFERNKRWSEDEDAFIKSNALTLNSLEIGEILGRTSAATKARSIHIGVYIRTKVDKRVVKKKKPKDISEAILNTIQYDTNGGCWLWPSDGRYGRLKFDGKEDLAHRASWKVFVGEIPHGLYVLHKCDVMPCCNPNHLFLGTAADNSADMMKKGRGVDRLGEKNTMAVLNKLSVFEIRSLIKSGEPQSAIAKKYGISSATVCDIKKRRSWKHV